MEPRHKRGSSARALAASARVFPPCCCCNQWYERQGTGSCRAAARAHTNGFVGEHTSACTCFIFVLVGQSDLRQVIKLYPRITQSCFFLSKLILSGNICIAITASNKWSVLLSHSLTSAWNWMFLSRHTRASNKPPWSGCPFYLAENNSK